MSTTTNKSTRRISPAADIAIGYAADARGSGVAYASISTGSSARVVRLTFSAPPLSALDGREQGYAAIAAIGAHVKSRGYGRVRIRLADAAVIADLSGSATPPRALSMAYVRVRCLLHSLGRARLEVADPVEVRDLAARARADVCLRAAA